MHFKEVRFEAKELIKLKFYITISFSFASLGQKSQAINILLNIKAYLIFVFFGRD